MEKKTVEGICANLKQLTTITQLQEFENRIGLTLSTCNATLTEYSTEHMQMKEVIRRFDELLSDKMSRN